METHRNAFLRRFQLRFGALVALLAILPALLAFAVSSPDARYFGFQFNTDDQMVYAAWAEQSARGQFFFDNRFTTDAQSGKTVHLYYWLFGKISGLLGYGVTETLARLVFSFLFVYLLVELLKLTKWSVFEIKFGAVLATLSGGLSFLSWHNFGNANTKVPFIAQAFHGLQTVDGWQPEAFVFPSMLTTSLFMMSLCLMLVTLKAIVQLKKGWSGGLIGALSIGLLMNVHSYDVLTIGLVLVGFATLAAFAKQLSLAWFVRVLVMCAAILPAALWFVHILQSDAVFRARAETPTFTAPFAPFLGGFLPVVGVCLVAWFKKPEESRRFWGPSALVIVLAVLFGLSSQAPTDALWLPMGAWALLFLLLIGVTTLLGTPDDETHNLLIVWAILGLVIPYFPALFQRKLAAGLMIPWGCLAGYSTGRIMEWFDRRQRNLVAITVVGVCCAGSALWLQRELFYVRNNVSRTAVQPVFLGPDIQQVLRQLQSDRDTRHFLIAAAGIPAGEGGDQIGTPYWPDYNPVVSGLAGMRTFAGHWSETPNYLQKRSAVSAIFFDAEQSRMLVKQLAPTYLLGPNPDTYKVTNLVDIRSYGETLYQGNQLVLVRVVR